MEEDLISIIIPMYNVSKYIRRCIESIKKQTYQEFEAIFIDDGSSDNTIEIWKENVKDDIRFLLIEKENSGVSDTRNYGIDSAKGKYITFIDSDDWVEPRYLEFLLNAIKKNNVQIACCGYFENNNEKEQRKLFFKDKILTKQEALHPYSEYYFTAIWGKLICKKFFLNNKFRSDIFFSEDTLLYTQIVDNCDKIFWSSKPLYHYYINNQGAMKVKNPKKYFTDFIARKEMCDIYSKYPTLIMLANFRTVESAINVKLEFMKQDFNDEAMLEELEWWIKTYKNIYLTSSYITKHNKLIYTITRYKICFFLYKLAKKIKNK